MAWYADVTGHAPLLPEWGAGFWQCKLRYKTRAELLAVAREYKQRGLMVYYDATNPEARQFVWEQVRKNYYQNGIKVW